MLETKGLTLLATILIVSARMMVLKKNDTTPWNSASRRNIPAGDLHVGNLAGHPDHIGKIHEIPIVRLVFRRELQPADQPVGIVVVIGRPVIAVGVMQREDDMDQEPGQNDGADDRRQIAGPRRRRRALLSAF